MCMCMHCMYKMQAKKSVPYVYRIAGNFRGVKYSLFSWAGWPPRNFIVGVAYLNVGMPCSHETKRNFYSRKLPFLELNEFFTPRNVPAIRYMWTTLSDCRTAIYHFLVLRVLVLPLDNPSSFHIAKVYRILHDSIVKVTVYTVFLLITAPLQ